MARETTYIALAQRSSDGDRALYGALDWTVDARDKQHAERIVRERWGYSGAIAVIPARFFTEFPAVATRQGGGGGEQRTPGP